MDNSKKNVTGERKGVRSKSAPLKSILKTVKRSSAKEILHTTLRAAGVPYTKAKEISGTGHGATHISIEQQRDKALKALDITLESQYKTLKKVRDGKMACNSDRIHAVKVINSMTPGWTAPEQVNVQTTGVFMELSGLSSREIAELAGLLQIESKEVDCVVSG